MRRYFISPHPTFGRTEIPAAFKVESSPYYWWWHALTLNEGYIAACENSGLGFDLVYKDFGDVRYQGNRHAAFKVWWNERVNTLEDRGAYLFAEPVLPGKSVSIVTDVDVAEGAISDPQRLLVNIPLDAQRKHIEWRLNNILKKHLKPESGRVVKSVRKSKARYSLEKPVVPDALKKTFDLYDAKRAAIAQGEKISNFELAKRARIKVKEREKEGEINTVENYRRTVSATVSRYIKQAERMIENAGQGVFP
ncbi:hypothetical protein K3740_05890 [Ruegeria conchae]|uniref:hypothetical protein n=1 Tax=Ruegeria conchae TaxID=981384 RepID=UPI00147E4024|nr:hypothetical protein [Ruegeria conchae]UWR04221.1 hypothetical protein K3740_05890 [Ruegeria conchae]